MSLIGASKTALLMAAPRCSMLLCPWKARWHDWWQCKDWCTINASGKVNSQTQSRHTKVMPLKRKSPQIKITTTPPSHSPKRLSSNWICPYFVTLKCNAEAEWMWIYTFHKIIMIGVWEKKFKWSIFFLWLHKLYKSCQTLQIYVSFSQF